MKLTRLEWFEAGYGTTAVDLGIISPDVFVKYIRYKVYQDFRSQKHDHSTAIELSAENCKCSTWTIREALCFMAGSTYQPQRQIDRSKRRKRKIRFADGQKIAP